MRYRFDDFTLDTELFELSRGGVPLRTEPQVIELLVMLVENRERMISKDEINQRVWHGRIVSEAALSSRIKMARQVLDDDGQTQRYIRTVHKKGFRFVGEVSTDAPGPADSAEAASGETAAAAPYSDERRAAASVRPGRPAVAVLPFANLSSDPEQEYFSDGVTADIIARLSKHRWIDVVARNTSFGFKGKAMDVREIGRLLKVNYVVEGSVQRAGNRIRVSAQLIDSESGHSKWAERYDREIADIFALQDEIAEMLAARLEPEIGIAERNKLIHARPANLEAWDCFHLGIFQFYKFTGEGNREAQRLLLQSQEMDPVFGDAYAWWAYAVVLGMVYWDTPPTQELFDAALGACDRALSIDAQNATFHALRARVLLARREYDQAIVENRMAIELNPSFAAAHCGMGDSLAYEARYDESIQCFEKAIALSPNDPQLWAFFTYGALALIFKGDFERALEWTERAASIPNCQYWTTAHRAVALAHLERIDEARAARDRLLREQPGFCCAFAREKLFYLKNPEQIARYVEGLRRAGIPER
jgi:TolB-like protein